ncbi:hypothetical protein DFH29DRAFT_882676, partial [Suillus ampliporus]
AWRAAVKQWEDPVASIGGKALKDWPEEWYTGPMRTITGVKRNIARLQQDEGVFLETYPEATHGVKPLFDAIQRQHEGRGEITGRAMERRLETPKNDVGNNGRERREGKFSEPRGRESGGCQGVT